MINAKWIAIPALTVTFVCAGALHGSLAKADNIAAMQDLSAKKGGHGKGHAKGHAKAKKGQGHYAYKWRGANSPYFCPPGQAKKPGWGSAHMC